MQLFVPIATSEELEDKNSWVNTGFEYPIEAYKNFFLRYGEAMAAWADVEMRLFSIYAFTIKSPEYRSLSASFIGLLGFRQKLDVTDAVMKNSEEVVYNEVEWGDIYNQCQKKSSQRNFLAHGTVYYDHVHPKETRRFFLSTGGATESRKYESELRVVRDSFMELGGRMVSFWSSLNGQKAK